TAGSTCGADWISAPRSGPSSLPSHREHSRYPPPARAGWAWSPVGVVGPVVEARPAAALEAGSAPPDLHRDEPRRHASQHTDDSAAGPGGECGETEEPPDCEALHLVGAAVGAEAGAAAGA